MPKTYKQYLGIIIIVGSLFLSSYFAIQKIISETLYGLIIIASVIVGFLIYKIDDIIEFETRWIKLKTLQKEIYAKVEEVERLSQEIKSSREELEKATRVFLESFYLTLQTRNVFPIPQDVAKAIEENLNILANFAIKDSQERQNWIDNIDKKLNFQKDGT